MTGSEERREVGADSRWSVEDVEMVVRRMGEGRSWSSGVDRTCLASHVGQIFELRQVIFVY